MTDPGIEPSSVEATVAGFIVWLARQHGPAEERHYCPAHVQRFLRWRDEQRNAGFPTDEQTYLRYLEAHHEPSAHVAEARTAIGLLKNYLRAGEPFHG